MFWFFCWYPDFPIPTSQFYYFFLFLLTTFTNKKHRRKIFRFFVCSLNAWFVYFFTFPVFLVLDFIQVTRLEINRCIIFCRTEFESESGLPQAAWRRKGGRRIDQRNGRTARTSASFGRRRRSQWRRATSNDSLRFYATFGIIIFIIHRFLQIFINYILNYSFEREGYGAAKWILIDPSWYAILITLLSDCVFLIFALVSIFHTLVLYSWSLEKNNVFLYSVITKQDTLGHHQFSFHDVRRENLKNPRRVFFFLLFYCVLFCCASSHNGLAE